VGGDAEDTGRRKDRFKIRDLFVDERCSRAILDFFSTTHVGRLVPTPAGQDAQSEASEHELRERQERQEAEETGALGVEQQLFLPTPSFMASAGGGSGVEFRGQLSSFLCLSFVIPWRV
jgi:hypothetical protein